MSQVLATPETVSAPETPLADKPADKPTDKTVEKKERPFCKYGQSCNRKADPTHREQWRHPVDKNKQVCKYGHSCNRKNDPTHRNQFRHLGGKNLPKVDGKVACKHGDKCFSTDPKHLSTFLHSSIRSLYCDKCKKATERELKDNAWTCKQCST